MSQWTSSRTELWIAAVWTKDQLEWQLGKQVCISGLLLSTRENIERNIKLSLDDALPPEVDRKSLRRTYAAVGPAILSGNQIQLSAHTIYINMFNGIEHTDATMRLLQVRLATRDGGWLLDPYMDMDTPWLGVGTPSTHHDPRATVEAARRTLITHNHGGIQRINDWLIITPATS